MTIKPLTNELDPAGTASPQFSGNIAPLAPLAPGAAATLTGLTPATNIKFEFENIRFNQGTGRYAAELRLRNTGASLGRNAVAAFPGLPSGVTLRNASGTTTAGAPYLNLQVAIPPGGLGSGEQSSAVSLEFDDPSRVPFTRVDLPRQ